MKQGTTARVAAAILAAAALLAGAGALHAQPLPPMDGPRVIYGSHANYGGRFAAPPVFAPDPAMPPYEVAGILRSRGFLPLGGPVRRGGFYVLSAVHPSGDHGRVVIDAYTGGVVRFLPASEVTRAARSDDMVLVYQGPTFPPPDAAPARVAAVPAPSARGVPRPPGLVPRVASRTPVTPKPRPEAAPQRPESAQAPPVPAPVETKPAAASPPLASKPIEKVLPPPSVQPTKPLPPVQTME